MIRVMQRWWFVWFAALALSFGFGVYSVSAQSNDTEAPEITNVQISSTTDSSVTITWETDEEADTAVNFSLQPNYGLVRIPTPEREQHSITLENLLPGSLYYFRVISSDENGNQGISADYRFETSGERQTGDGQGTGQADADGEGPGQTDSTTESTTVTVTTPTVQRSLRKLTKSLIHSSCKKSSMRPLRQFKVLRKT
jgi:Fibronectin type III domain.